MIARLSEAMGAALVGNNFWLIPLEFHFPMKNALCLCSPFRPAQAVLERCPKSLAIDFAVNPSIVFWNSLRK